jgi:hypothetical protein
LAQDRGAALTVAMAFYRAWTDKDMDLAMTYVADDIVCDAPPGRILGAERYRPFLANFLQTLTGSDMIAAFGDDETALLTFDTHTTLVETAPAAECLTVKEGRIIHSRLIFDQTPFIAARSGAA